MHMNTIEAVAALIACPSRWAPGNVEARDAAGAAVEATSAGAVAWSIGGAITRVINPDADDITDAEWQRRTELEVEVYRWLGLTTERADCGLANHAVVMSVLRATA